MSPFQLAAIGFLSLAVWGLNHQDARPEIGTDVSDCKVSTPTGTTPPGVASTPNNYWFWNGEIGTALWPDGTATFRPHGAGFVQADGSLKMKFYWMVAGPGELSVGGRRLDAVAPPLKAEVGPRLADGGNPSYLIFPTEGCWEVTAKANGSVLTFVTRVVRTAS